MFSSNTSQTSGGYEIQRSLRFNSADSAYLNRTPASATNRKTWTWSAWFKRSELPGTRISLFACLFGGNDNSTFWLGFDENNRLAVGVNTVFLLQTSSVYRDVSAWYHVALAVDTTQATAANRLKLYVNGTQITAFDTNNLATAVSQNMDLAINAAQPHTLGRIDLPAWYFPGYMTEVNFIDGQALTPSSFGAFDAQTGVWGPTPYAGSYGTNGFYLNFSDNSNTTAATLGRDYSGNGNNWTPNNFSVSAGAGNDSLVDVPTNWGTDTGVGGSVRGNYCTLNPLYGNPAPTNGNLEVTVNNTTVYGSLSFTSGKWYWEVTPTVVGGILYIGVMNSAYIKTDGAWGATTARTYVSNGTTFGSNGGTYGASYTTNDIIGIALDMDAGSITFYKNGASQGTAFTNLGGNEWRPLVYASETSTLVCNFGQRPFAYTAPSGFKALNTQNLPTPTIGATTATQASQFFTPVLYTGDGTNNRFISAGMTPDWTWIKARNNTSYHELFDSVRGTGKYLVSNLTSAENSSGNIFPNSGPTTGGFTVDYGGVNEINGLYNFVAWNWRANGAGVTNTAGSITSTVSANTTSGFSVVTYTGSGAAATVGHGLGSAPRMIIVKARNFARNWNVYHASLGATQGINLNATAAATTDSGWWNNTAPTSAVFTAGSYSSEGTVTYVAYCFAEIPGYSRFGSYTGNGSADGPFLYLGFTPKYILIKQSSSAGTNWRIITINTSYLSANTADAEYDSPPGPIRGMSNGVKIVGTGGDINGNGSTFIYAAFAAFPFKYALAQSA